MTSVNFPAGSQGLSPDVYAQQYANEKVIALLEAISELSATYGAPESQSSIFAPPPTPFHPPIALPQENSDPFGIQKYLGMLLPGFFGTSAPTEENAVETVIERRNDYDNGELVRREQTTNGNLNWTDEYGEEGRIFTSYKDDGESINATRRFSEDGKTVENINTYNEDNNRTFRSFDEDGNNRIVQTYNEDGSLKWRGIFENGEMVSKQTYNEDGSLKWRGLVENGEVVRHISFDENGEPIPRR